MSCLRVVSYNIHKGRSAFMSRARLDALRLGLHGLQADLVFLQEIQGRNHKASHLDAQPDSLGAALSMEVAYGRNAIRAHSDHGNALLSRYPIRSFENQDVSDHALEQRGLLHAQIEIRGETVHCFVVHLGLFAASRVRQTQSMVERIRAMVPDDSPVLIAGDFNDWNDLLSRRLMEALGVREVFAAASRSDDERIPRLRDTPRALTRLWREVRGQGPVVGAPKLGSVDLAPVARPPRTFPAMLPWLRLDRIYQRGFAVRRARVLRGLPWRGLSDHAPLLVDLELP